MDALAQATSALLGIGLSGDQRRRVQRYAEELLRWNQRANLTAITDPVEIATKHFLDSFSCWLALVPASPRRVIDVGTGAGFPGLALKILVPALEVTLVEATGKKAEFCRHVVKTLDMRQVDVIHGRAEDVAHEAAHREMYDGAWPCRGRTAHAGRVSLASRGWAPGVAQRRNGHRRRTLRQVPCAARGVLRKMVAVGAGIVETRYLVVMEKVASTP
jgi:16S rRNA (guanine527-N7)-methyltransferase